MQAEELECQWRRPGGVSPKDSHQERMEPREDYRLFVRPLGNSPMSVLAKQVADRLAKLRSERNLTQAQVADQIGRTGSHVSNIENQRTDAELKLSEIEKL